MSESRHGGTGWRGSPTKTAVTIHLSVRAAVFLAVLIAAAVHPLDTGSLGGDLGSALGKSDGVWYLGIAHHGYGAPPPIGPDGAYTRLTSLAFFPLYPMLIRLVTFTGLPYLGAALLVTLIAGSVAAAAIVAWARPIVGQSAAFALLLTWELLPSNVVLGMAYSEALFVAAAAVCLLALQRNAWIAAGVAAAVGGMTRPTGGCLVLAIAVAAFVDHRSRRGAGHADAARASWWRPAAALVIGIAGVAASLVHVAVVTGRIDGWFWLERTVWRSGFDGGLSALHDYGQLLTGGRAAHRFPDVVAAVTVVAAIAAALWWRRAAQRPDPPAAAYAGSALILAAGERGYFYVKPRLLFVAFPLLVPLCTRIAALSRGRQWTLGLSIGLLSVSYNAYLLVGWPKAL